MLTSITARIDVRDPQRRRQRLQIHDIKPGEEVVVTVTVDGEPAGTLTWTAEAQRGMKASAVVRLHATDRAGELAVVEPEPIALVAEEVR